VYTVNNSSRFTMTGGTITNNTASFAGGGLYLETYAQGTMEGGTISNNESQGAGGAGGVLVNWHSQFTLNDGTISDNKSSGVSINGAGSAFTLSGGTISGNTNGGVWVNGSNTGFFTMTGGIISGNSGGSGAGVRASNNATFKKEPVPLGTTSGIIFGYDPSDPDNSNTVTAGGVVESGKGHAVYISDTKKRETTVGPDQDLDSAQDGAAGGWVD
jgi:hypothetical protein